MRKLLFGLLLSGCVTAAQAADWVYLGSSMGGTSLYSLSPVKTSKTNARVWVRYVEPSGVTQTNFYEFNCKTGYGRALSAVGRRANGSVYFEYDTPSEWLPVRPESVWDYARTYACA